MIVGGTRKESPRDKRVTRVRGRWAIYERPRDRIRVGEEWRVTRVEGLMILQSEQSSDGLESSNHCRLI